MRIAIFTLGSRGDVQPYVALASYAIKEGHEAVICTGRTFEKMITEYGVEFKEANSDLMALFQTEEGQMIFKHAMKHPLKTKAYVKDVINPAFRKTLDQFWESSQGADVIIYHPKAFGAPDMAKALGIPCVSMPPVPITYPIEEFPNLALAPTKNFGSYMNKLTYKLMMKAESASIHEVNDFREQTLGLPKRKSGLYAFQIGEEEIPTIYPISPSLFEDVTSWNGKVFLPGFFFLEREGEKLDDQLGNFLAEGSPPIVISFSSMPLKNPNRFKEVVVEALKKTNNRGIILVGNSGMKLESMADILMIKETPHTQLFPLAKGIIHHGGVGSMAGALKSGKPQLIIPFSVDQPFWAKRLHTLGYALKPLKEKEVRVDTLVDTLITMENSQIRQKAEEIKQLIDSEQGVKKTLEYIETLYVKRHF